MIKNIPLVLLFIILLFSCRKEENSSIPVIEVHLPEYLALYDVYDTISVQATISDEIELESIQVKLTDSNFNPVTKAEVFYPGTMDYNLSTKIVIDNPSLESGHYYVLVKANNGNNSKNKYQEIILQGLEQEFKQLLIITEGTANTIQVFRTDDLESADILTTFDGDFTASAISPADKLLFVAGENSLNLLAYNLETNTVAWQKQKTPGLPMHNPECLCFNGLLYTTYNYNYIHGYTATGQINYDVFIDEFDAPGIIYKHSDFILTEIQKKNAVDPYIATTFALTGEEKQRRLITDDVVAFESVDEDQVLVIFNKNNQGSIYLYDVQNDLMSFRHDVPERINTTVKVSGETLVLAGNEKLFAYSMENEVLFTILEKGATILAWEHIQNVLLLGNETVVEGFVYPEMVNQKTLQFSDTILDMQIQYTK